MSKPPPRDPPHWLAVDRCFATDERAEALAYARRRLGQIERRPPHRVEVEAVVVACPLGHAWPEAEPVVVAVA